MHFPCGNFLRISLLFDRVHQWVVLMPALLCFSPPPPPPLQRAEGGIRVRTRGAGPSRFSGRNNVVHDPFPSENCLRLEGSG